MTTLWIACPKSSAPHEIHRTFPRLKVLAKFQGDAELSRESAHIFSQEFPPLALYRIKNSGNNTENKFHIFVSSSHRLIQCEHFSSVFPYLFFPFRNNFISIWGRNNRSNKQTFHQEFFFSFTRNETRAMKKKPILESVSQQRTKYYSNFNNHQHTTETRTRNDDDLTSADDELKL